ncbi:hypothetical protein D3C84_1302900 [compost metagenome]
MQKDWQAASEDGESNQTSETLQLEPEGDEPAERPEWVEEAFKMFGDQLVELKRD